MIQHDVLTEFMASKEAAAVRERIQQDRDSKRLALHNEKSTIQADSSRESATLRKQLHAQQECYNSAKAKLVAAEQELKRLEDGLSRIRLNSHTRLQRIDSELIKLANPALGEFIAELEELHHDLLQERPVVREQHAQNAFGNTVRTALLTDAKSKARLLAQIRTMIDDTRQRQLDPEQDSAAVGEWIDTQRQSIRPAQVERLQ